MKTIISIILLFIIGGLSALPISPEQARQVAENLCNERSASALVLDEIIPLKHQDETILFYLITFKPIGFVLVASDDAIYPIPAYSWENNFTNENVPIQFADMLDTFKKAAKQAIDLKLVASEIIRNEWLQYNVAAHVFNPVRDLRVVTPLLSTNWDQGSGWNSSCPVDAAGPGGYCWAGCTAVATAQVMKHHGHPTIGEGSHSYSCPPYGTQSANFAATTYNWASMPNNTASTATRQLLYHVGVGAEMQYGSSSSGAWIGGTHPASALSTLQNNFRYNPNSYYAQKAFFNSLVWDGMLKMELDNSRPLVYAGYGNGSGHAFVLDGYQGISNNHYHINWGWSGSYNGWFYLNSLIPSPGYDYTNDQEALFMVEPRKWKPLPDESIDVSQLTYLGVDLDSYCEVTATSYSVVTDLTSQEFSLTINSNNILVFTANPTVTANVNIDIIIRATYSGGIADDVFNFIITGASTLYDYGDAPDPSYPTLISSSGAVHTLDGVTWLGSTVDGEQDGQPTSNADGDDNDVNGDDEDGIVFTSNLFPGGWANYTATASVGGYLNAWIDFDQNGNWGDPGEQVTVDQIITAGSNNLNFFVPITALLGDTFIRFRFSTSQGILYYGSAPDGEVEDYMIEIGQQESSTKWEQLPDLSPLGMDVYATDNYPNNAILADDFLCTTTGPITDIHVWGSWLGDYLPEDLYFLTFNLSIHADIPDPDGDGPEYSIPGEVLWMGNYTGEEFISELYHVGPEGWYNPLSGEYYPEGDTQCWLYNFFIDEEYAFWQEGTPDNPIVYWLNVQVFAGYEECQFGWKTAETHWNDDAVWGVGWDPYDGPWNELIYPFGHEYEGQSIDLAFSITTLPEEPDELDFGDSDDPNYPTLLANDGARHIIDYATFMGSSIDAEPDGQPTAIASGDDNDGNDDEDGVALANLFAPGGTGNIIVTASTAGYLNAWADFNIDGDWADATEQIFNNTPLSSGSNTIHFTIPASASSGLTNFRFRFTTYSVPTPSYTGLETDGEVEDYLLRIQDLDFGDADEIGTSFPTTLANNGARHVIIPNFNLGSLIDAEPDGQPDVTATGDDNNGTDDEDGIIFMTTLVPGQQAIIDIYNTILAGVNGYLDGWIDFNADGDWDDPGEQIFNNYPLAGWPINYNSVFISVPANAAANNAVFSRFRMSSTGGLPYSGLSSEGEVEDYYVNIIEPFGENKIHHPQWPDNSPEGIDIYDEDPIILADDFLCIETGAITEIHFWGSWLDDAMQSRLLSFEISFWSDIPDPDETGPLYSMPGDMLWSAMFYTFRYTEDLYLTLQDPEWWYNPLDGNLIQNADYQIWHYKFLLDEQEEEVFVQQEGDIYWISIRAFDPTNPEETYNFGWKTCDIDLHWNDDAVWCPGDMIWQELIYPTGHPYNPQSLGLSFYLSGVPLPATPIDVTITKNSDHIRVDWTAGLPTDRYNVYSSTNPYSPFPSGWILETSTSYNFWLDGPPLPGPSKKFYRVTRE